MKHSTNALYISSAIVGSRLVRNISRICLAISEFRVIQKEVHTITLSMEAAITSLEPPRCNARQDRIFWNVKYFQNESNAQDYVHA